MNLAFFLLHREAFGRFGRQQLMNTLFIIGINLVFGFTAPGIDNLAHLGGLAAGFGLGYGLAPRYQIDPYLYHTSGRHCSLLTAGGRRPWAWLFERRRAWPSRLVVGGVNYDKQQKGPRALRIYVV
jgi:hypothetical protein